MQFDPNTILAQKSTTVLALIEELACEYSRYLIAEPERQHDIMSEINDIITALEYAQRV